VAALALLAAVMMICCLLGTEDVSLKAVFKDLGNVEATSPDHLIFMRVRLPRVILAAIVGAALACAGVIFQALLRNPLADPYILGISSGAGLGTIIAVISGFSWTLWGRSPVAVFAFIGAMATVWLVWMIGRLTGKNHVTGLLLAGVVISAFFSAMIMFLTSISRSKQVYATIFWLMGNIAEEDYLVLIPEQAGLCDDILAHGQYRRRRLPCALGQFRVRAYGYNLAFLHQPAVERHQLWPK